MSFEFDKIGILPDTHHTNDGALDRRFQFILSGPRFYSETEADVAEATNTFNSRACGCMVQLGDGIDDSIANSVAEGNSNNSNTGAEGEANLADFISHLDNFTGPIYQVIGNWEMHDFDFGGGLGDDVATADYFKHIRLGTRSPETIIEIAGTTYTDKDANPKGARYYMFECPNGTIGVVLDTTGTTENDAEEYANQNSEKSLLTSESWVPLAQRNWLIAALNNYTDRPIVIFNHYWLYPNQSGYYQCRNASTIRAILEDYNAARIAAGHKGRILADFAGHHHPGTEGFWSEDGNPVGDPREYLTPTLPESSIFGVEHNKIKYFNCRCPIVGWGNNPDNATDDGSGGEATPANSYYIATVGEFVKGVFDIKVEGFGANPVGNSKSSKQYLVTKNA